MYGSPSLCRDSSDLVKVQVLLTGLAVGSQVAPPPQYMGWQESGVEGKTHTSEPTLSAV